MKVSHILKTKSYKSDGRVLKWIASLKAENIDSELFVLEDKNESGQFEENEVSIETIKLSSRKWFPKRKGYLFKVPEYSVKAYRFVKRSNADVFVFHDVQHYLTLFLIATFKKRFLGKRFVWDLHELPHAGLRRLKISRTIIKFILEKMDLLVYTNEERRKSILKNFKHAEGKYFVLNNYPGLDYITAAPAPIDKDLSDWLKDTPYLLWMGMASKGRRFPAVLDAYQGFKNQFKLVVMGSIDLEMQAVIKELGLQAYIFQKFVRQDQISGYVDNSMFSIVLYGHTSLNNYYCEPNRLYQLLSRNIPVIVGKNPQMISITKEVKGGIVLEDDGSNPDYLKQAIAQLLQANNIVQLKDNLKQYDFTTALNWDAQFGNIIPVLQSLTANPK